MRASQTWTCICGHTRRREVKYPKYGGSSTPLTKLALRRADDCLCHHNKQCEKAGSIQVRGCCGALAALNTCLNIAFRPATRTLRTCKAVYALAQMTAGAAATVATVTAIGPP